MPDRKWNRWGAVAGLVMVAAFVAALLVTGSPPKPEDADQVFKQYIADKSDEFILQGWLLGVAAAMFLWFASAVRSVLRRGEGEDGYLANLFFATAVVISALIIASSAPGVTLAYKTAATSTPAFARFVFDVGGVVIAIFSIAAATGAVAFALVVLATEVLPKWTGWLALLSAAGSLIGSFVIFGDTGAFSVEGTAGFLGFGLFVIWSLGTAIAMLQKAGAPQAVA